jgi:hypothetical protein
VTSVFLGVSSCASWTTACSGFNNNRIRGNNKRVFFCFTLNCLYRKTGKYLILDVIPYLVFQFRLAHSVWLVCVTSLSPPACKGPSRFLLEYRVRIETCENVSVLFLLSSSAQPACLFCNGSYRQNHPELWFLYDTGRSRLMRCW